MTDLTPLSPAAGLLPLTIGAVTLEEPDMQPMHLVAPFKGQSLPMPAPNQMISEDGRQSLWFGREQALVIGDLPSGLAGRAAVTDQSDAWTRLVLSGADARDVLARLTPLDLRDSAFPTGSATRTELFHMQSSIARLGPEAWQIMTFRSMAGTLVHDLKVAMEGVAARG